MRERTEWRLTATFVATTASGRKVTVKERTEFEHFPFLEGGGAWQQGIKKYTLTTGEPVNCEDGGLHLSATGERLSINQSS